MRCLQSRREDPLLPAFLWDFAKLNAGTYTTVFCDGPVP
jgi:hypothetical protein